MDKALSTTLLAWIESHVHERVVESTPLSGGWTSRMLALRDAAGRDSQNHNRGASDRRHWDVMDIVGFLPDPTKVLQPWRDQGRDIADRAARDRFERHLRRVLHG